MHKFKKSANEVKAEKTESNLAVTTVHLMLALGQNATQGHVTLADVTGPPTQSTSTQGDNVWCQSELPGWTDFYAKQETRDTEAVKGQNRGAK